MSNNTPEVSSTHMLKPEKRVTGYIIGTLSLVPFLGLVFGIGAIVVGFNDKRKLPIVLGILSFVVTFGTGFYLYMTLSSDDQTLISPQQQVATANLQQDAALAELYKQQHHRYPTSMSDLETVSNGKPVHDTDPWNGPIVYDVSYDGQSYVLRSAGPSGFVDDGDDLQVSYPANLTADDMKQFHGGFRQ
jgi:hypothetical protein